MPDIEEAGTDFRGPISGDIYVYRILDRSSRISPETGKPLNIVFQRRPPHPETGKERDVEGLSVAIAYHLTFEELAIYFLRTRNLYCYASARLAVQDILSIPTFPQLRVVQNSDHHANIVGLPKHGENETKTSTLATALSSLSEVVWTNPLKKS